MGATIVLVKSSADSVLPPMAGAFRGRQRRRVLNGWEEEMPTYDYSCLNCGKKFSVTHSIIEHVKKKVSCPKCKSQKVEMTISSVFIKTSKKS